MKFGIRKFSWKKSLSARTKGRLTRAVKRSVNPFYGKKGMGVVRDPERAAKNYVYRRTTLGVNDIVKAANKKRK